MLAPSLKRGQTVIMDNLSIHQGDVSGKPLKPGGCRLLFLPAYSPDFSPIEEAFLRRVGARTRETLQEAIAQALTLITAQDALGWFLHCGYPSPPAAEIAQSL
jgi:transposase